MNGNLSEVMQKKFSELKPILDKFKKYTIDNVPELVGITLLPPVKPKEGQTAPKDRNDILVVVNLDTKKNPLLEKEKIIKKLDAKTALIDKNLKAFVVETYDVREDCFEGKYTILDEVTDSAILYDPKDYLVGIKVSNLHKGMVLNKFKKYIVSYVAAGSAFRGDKVSHDFDTYIILDDTDVKRMTRVELRDKLGGVLRQLAKEANLIVGVKKPLHLQTYLFTDFWESVRDAHPVMFTFLRDGVPMYDRGVFMPWKLLLKMGRIRPSPEAIDMQMSTGVRLVKRAKDTLLTIATSDLFYSLLNPAQAALMLYGIAPPTPRECIKLMEEIFVKKEKMLNIKYVHLLQKLFDIFKGIEHGKIKSISGAEVDQLLKESEEYLKALQKIFTKMQKLRDKESVDEMFKSAMDLTSDLLKAEGVKKVNKTQIVLLAKTHLVNKKKLLSKELETLKQIIKIKKTYAQKPISPQELEKVRREARLLFKTLTEQMQRNMGFELDRVKVKFKYGEKIGEAMLLDNRVFIIEDLTAKDKILTEGTLNEDGSFKDLEKSTFENLERHLSKAKIPDKVFIKEKTFESLRKTFGNDVQIMVHY